MSKLIETETLLLFKEILTGDFDNQNQIDEERKAGKQIHPFAVHINREFTDRVHNKPADLNGIYILEESYYTYEGKEKEIKPYLFFIEPVGEDQVRLHSIQIPSQWDTKDVYNANPDLYFNYDDLKESERFKPGIYTRTENHFNINHPNDLGNGMSFTLIETLSRGRLQVMELLEKDGVRLTPYATPILYDKK